MFARVKKGVGPIIVSALSLFITFHILQPIALFLDPRFSLLLNKGIGKIALTVMVIYQILLLSFLLPHSVVQKIAITNIGFFKEKKWFTEFVRYFLIFAALHCVVLALCYLSGALTLNPGWGTLKKSMFIKLGIGFIATFFLAWTEELIFRGTLFVYWCNTCFSKLTSALLSSAIFSLSHNLIAPWTLITTQWRLGLGLFLLGLFLNLIFIATGKLYIGMGAHAGLKFVKVFLKVIPIAVFTPAAYASLWFHPDLRQSLLVHGLFFVINGIMIAKMWKKHFSFDRIFF